MLTRISKLTLRDFFWLMMFAAIGVGWYLEQSRAAKQLAEYKVRWQFGQIVGPPSTELLQRQQLLLAYRSLSNVELNRSFGRIEPASAYHVSANYQCCLTEMVRRRMHAELQEHYDALQRSGNKPPGGLADAQLLTALRRAQGKPDPVEVHVNVDVPTSPVNGSPETGPSLLVNLKNVDQLPVSLTRGGDYRSGRQTRWRMQLTNEKGVRSADSNFPVLGMGGGISQFGPLEPKALLYDSEANRLDVRNYVKSPPTGRYQLQVIYSEQEIAAEPDLTGFIVWQSQPITVRIENQSANREQRFSALPLLGILVGGAAVFVVRSRIQSRSQSASDEPPRGALNSRDFVAFALLLSLTIGWYVSARVQSNKIERLRPDQQAHWTMQAIEAE